MFYQVLSNSPVQSALSEMTQFRTSLVVVLGLRVIKINKLGLTDKANANSKRCRKSYYPV
jgi:hypothetical protein